MNAQAVPAGPARQLLPLPKTLPALEHGFALVKFTAAQTCGQRHGDGLRRFCGDLAQQWFLPL